MTENTYYLTHLHYVSLLFQTGFGETLLPTVGYLYDHCKKREGSTSIAKHRFAKSSSHLTSHSPKASTLSAICKPQHIPSKD